jgi:hypothetical protein
VYKSSYSSDVCISIPVHEHIGHGTEGTQQYCRERKRGREGGVYKSSYSSDVCISILVHEHIGHGTEGTQQYCRERGKDREVMTATTAVYVPVSSSMHEGATWSTSAEGERDRERGRVMRAAATAAI